MKDKIAQWNEMLLFLNEIKKIYSPMPGFYSVYLIRVLGVSWGVCRSFLLTKWRLDSASKALCFLAEIRSHRWIAHLFSLRVTFRRTLWPSFRLRHNWKSALLTAQSNISDLAGAFLLLCEFWRPRVQLQPLIWRPFLERPGNLKSKSQEK